MRYQCRDCSYRGDKVSQAGSCPACGSFNIVREQQPGSDAKSGRTWQLRLLVALWTVLIGMIVHKLLS